MLSGKNQFSCSLLVGLVVMTASARAQQIAFTWDDLPAHSALPPGETRVEIGKKLIAAMKAAKLLPVYGFVNGISTEEQPLSTPMLKEWRDAGFLLANHTWSHMNLNQHSLEDWKADVLKNETLLNSYMGTGDWHWLRFPNLGEGDTPEKREGARRFLAEQRYRIAGVTMSFGDYLLMILMRGVSQRTIVRPFRSWRRVTLRLPKQQSIMTGRCRRPYTAAISLMCC